MTGYPRQNEGDNGDIILSSTIDGPKIFAKIQNTWHTFSTSKKVTGQMHILKGGYNHDGNGEKFLPLAQSRYDGQPNNVLYCSFMVPYVCNVKEIILRSEEAAGSTVVKTFKAVDGTEIPATELESITMDMAVDDTPYAFKAIGSRLYAGNVLSISVDPTTTINDCIFTIILEYEI